MAVGIAATYLTLAARFEEFVGWMMKDADNATCKRQCSKRVTLGEEQRRHIERIGKSAVKRKAMKYKKDHGGYHVRMKHEWQDDPVKKSNVESAASGTKPWFVGLCAYCGVYHRGNCDEPSKGEKLTTCKGFANDHYRGLSEEDISQFGGLSALTDGVMQDNAHYCDNCMHDKCEKRGSFDSECDCPDRSVLDFEEDTRSLVDCNKCHLTQPGTLRCVHASDDPKECGNFIEVVDPDLSTTGADQGGVD